MEGITLVILSAGSSSRFTLEVKKQWLRIGDDPLWLVTARRLAQFHNFKEVIVVGHPDEVSYMKNFDEKFKFVSGGNSRQESMANALEIVETTSVMVTDVARSCVPKKVIVSLVENVDKADCIVPALNVNDTVVFNEETIDRNSVKLIQTPQLSKSDILKTALQTSKEFTDDSSAIKELGGSIYYVQGSQKSAKLTFGDEISNLDCLAAPSNDCFHGIGYDIHPFEDGKQMVLGGVEIDSPFGFKAHSDGDVLIHSVIDAILGSIGAGDIGEFFPDTDQKYKGANSRELLEEIVHFTKNVGYEIINIDILVIAQVPKVNPYKEQIKTTMANLLNLPRQKVNIKATTAEKLGFIGRCEGVAVQSSANTKYYNWKEK